MGHPVICGRARKTLLVFITLGAPQAHGDTAEQAAEKFVFLTGTLFSPYATIVESTRLYRLRKNSDLYQGTTLVGP